MPTPLHETFTTNRGEEKKIRQRFESRDLIEYELTEADIRRRPGFLFRAMAEKFYDDEAYHWVLRDNNDLKREREYVAGDVLKVPADFRDAIAGANIVDPAQYARATYSVR